MGRSRAYGMIDDYVHCFLHMNTTSDRQCTADYTSFSLTESLHGPWALQTVSMIRLPQEIEA